MGGEWSIEAIPSADGVDLRITLPTENDTLTAVLTLDRDQARTFGRSVLAAAGDALKRTYSAPSSRPRMKLCSGVSPCDTRRDGSHDP
jgi:hypothetical protein